MMKWLRALFGRGEPPKTNDLEEYRGQLEQQLHDDLELLDEKVEMVRQQNQEAQDTLLKLEARERYYKFGPGRR